MRDMRADQGGVSNRQDDAGSPRPSSGKKTAQMSRSDVIAKLEAIAAGGGTIAELNACKALLALPEFGAGGSDESADPFDEFDEVAKARAKRAG